ncbi:membrane protein [Pseudorhizobium halotolerans]|uniref:Membrane protein n=1 Tax=Pseudorhizobium halotolerans TaxID=1233081 RepID=A0ABN7JCE8_9HYPH|nr:mitofilin family membrane protein [Pseudorhizobium halotolerans]CAD7023161.1 membrane protein [Pseudorhizobium halotolerans]
MEPEKPNRRPKAKKEPTTIDLTAEEASVAEPVRSNDSDNGTDTSPETSFEEKQAAETAASSPPPTPESADAETSPEPMPTEPQPEPIAAPEDTGAQEEEPAPQARSSGPSASTLVAAGIFGGIVALALAGSMQYAGYLPAAAPSQDSSADIQALRQEVEALRQAPASAPAPDPEITSRLDALETAVAQRADDSGIEERLASLEQQLQSVQSASQGTASENSARLDELQGRLDTAEAKLNEPGAEEAAARAIAAAALKAAIDRGGAFAGELETFAAVSPDPQVADQLRPYAEDGVPTHAQLVERFASAREAILDAVSTPQEDQGITSRLMSSALSVVKVRRTGDTQGDSPEAIVSRMENALQSGDLSAAATEWNALPQEAKDASGDFKQALDARIAVNGLIGDALTRAVSETGAQN